MEYGKGKYTYEEVEGWVKTPNRWEVINAPGLSIDSQDRLYVMSRGQHPIMLFDREGNLLTTMGEKKFACLHAHHMGAHSICVDPEGSVYGADDSDHTVTKFSSEGKVLMILGNKGQPSYTGYVQGGDPIEDLKSIKQVGPPFNRPSGIALSSSGEIYVTDGYGNARVHKFAPDGTLLLSWGEPGKGPGQFRLPHGVWVDKQERVWVCDRENSRIQTFDTQGKFLNQWTDLSRPTGIFIDDEGIVYVSELNRRVSIFNNDGELLARWGSPKEEEDETAVFVGPHSIVADSRGDVYIGEIRCSVGSNAVHKYARKT